MSDPNAPLPRGESFVPADLETMTPSHRQAYAARLATARDKLLAIRQASSDGQAIAEVIEEIDVAIHALTGRVDSRGNDAG